MYILSPMYVLYMYIIYVYVYRCIYHVYIYHIKKTLTYDTILSVHATWQTLFLPRNDNGSCSAMMFSGHPIKQVHRFSQH